MRLAVFVATMCISCSLCAQARECGKIASARFGHVAVTAAKLQGAGTPISRDDGEPVGKASVDFCRIYATSRPTKDSEIGLELWVPAGGAWNGKFEQVGNGGFAGTLPYRLMVRGIALGYAVAGTDDGHRAREMTDASWALDHPEKIKDFGYRAIQETALASKRLLRMLESKSPSKAYFYGCSDGGREALMMAQRFPTYFDGIVAGAPAYAMTRLLTAGAMLGPALADHAGHLGAAQLKLLQDQALKSCGNGASYLQDPRNCRIDLQALECGAEAREACLTQAQIKTARAIYAEQTDPASGAALHPQLPGAEALEGSWADWITGRDDHETSAVKGFVWNYLAYMVMADPKLDAATVTEADLASGERSIGAIIDSQSADLSAFKAHGGKLIQFHGWNDPAIPAGYSIEYRDRLKAKMGSIDDFYRLYMVPGMLHCAGGAAPTEVNWLGALENWVEHGTAPADLSAHGKEATQVLHPAQ
jgi:feruloyl esterase